MKNLYVLPNVELAKSIKAQHETLDKADQYHRKWEPKQIEIAAEGYHASKASRESIMAAGCPLPVVAFNGSVLHERITAQSDESRDALNYAVAYSADSIGEPWRPIQKLPSLSSGRDKNGIKQTIRDILGSDLPELNSSISAREHASLRTIAARTPNKAPTYKFVSPGTFDIDPSNNSDLSVADNTVPHRYFTTNGLNVPSSSSGDTSPWPEPTFVPPSSGANFAGPSTIPATAAPVAGPSAQAIASNMVPGPVGRIQAISAPVVQPTLAGGPAQAVQTNAINTIAPSPAPTGHPSHSRNPTFQGEASYHSHGRSHPSRGNISSQSNAQVQMDHAGHVVQPAYYAPPSSMSSRRQTEPPVIAQHQGRQQSGHQVVEQDRHRGDRHQRDQQYEHRGDRHRGGQQEQHRRDQQGRHQESRSRSHSRSRTTPPPGPQDRSGRPVARPPTPIPRSASRAHSQSRMYDRPALDQQRSRHRSRQSGPTEPPQRLSRSRSVTPTFITYPVSAMPVQHSVSAWQSSAVEHHSSSNRAGQPSGQAPAEARHRAPSRTRQAEQSAPPVQHRSRSDSHGIPRSVSVDVSHIGIHSLLRAQAPAALIPSQPLHSSRNEALALRRTQRRIPERRAIAASGDPSQYIQPPPAAGPSAHRAASYSEQPIASSSQYDPYATTAPNKSRKHRPSQV
ncbi:unnamed protein product [Mycena citricolor]|uniref:Uncharacterized protein n=1 Tax=Mycena citricolor TaxID=2018698 RepID=A0AAD2GVL4_9AGAR|nr:unnamed protein product [Mycena citricolor]